MVNLASAARCCDGSGDRCHRRRGCRCHRRKLGVAAAAVAAVALAALVSLLSHGAKSTVVVTAASAATTITTTRSSPAAVEDPRRTLRMMTADSSSTSSSSSASSSCLQIVADENVRYNPKEASGETGDSPCFVTPDLSDTPILQIRIVTDVCGIYMIQDTRTGLTTTWTSSDIVYCTIADGREILIKSSPSSNTAPAVWVFFTTTQSTITECTTQPLMPGFLGEQHIQEVVSSISVSTTTTDQQQQPDKQAETGTIKNRIHWYYGRYLLQADHFEYNVVGEDGPMTIGGPNTIYSIEAGGDPGWDSYMTIEIVWYYNNFDGNPPTEKRFFGYFESNPSNPGDNYNGADNYGWGHNLEPNTWNMFEARVYNNAKPYPDWESFTNLQGRLSGTRDTCYQNDGRLVLTNERGSTITFENLTLGVFLPWEDESKVLDCFFRGYTATDLDTYNNGQSSCIQEENHNRGNTNDGGTGEDDATDTTIAEDEYDGIDDTNVDDVFYDDNDNAFNNGDVDDSLYSDNYGGVPAEDQEQEAEEEEHGGTETADNDSYGGNYNYLPPEDMYGEADPNCLNGIKVSPDGEVLCPYYGDEPVEQNQQQDADPISEDVYSVTRWEYSCGENNTIELDVLESFYWPPQRSGSNMDTSTVFGIDTCIKTPSSVPFVKLTIQNDLCGRYSLMHEPPPEMMFDGDGPTFVGYAWNSPTAGIYYCVGGNTSIFFDTFVRGSVLNITAEAAEEDSCVSEYLAISSYKPLPVTDSSKVNATSPSAVAWSSHRFVLLADHFEYQVAGDGNVAVTLNEEMATNIQVGGDPGDESYMTIEIVWFIDGAEKRLNVYFESINGAWNAFEARVYDTGGEWEYFNNLPEQGLGGDVGSCFEKESFTITNDNGSRISFDNLTLAIFLMWDDQENFLECVGLPSDTNVLSGPSCIAVADDMEEGTSSPDPHQSGTINLSIIVRYSISIPNDTASLNMIIQDLQAAMDLLVRKVLTASGSFVSVESVVTEQDSGRRRNRSLQEMMLKESTTVASLDMIDCPDNSPNTCYIVIHSIPLLLLAEDDEQEGPSVTEMTSIIEKAIYDGILQEELAIADPETEIIAAGVSPSPTDTTLTEGIHETQAETSTLAADLSAAMLKQEQYLVTLLLLAFAIPALIF